MRTCPHCGQPIPEPIAVGEGQKVVITGAPIAPAAAANPGVVYRNVSFDVAGADPSPPRSLPDYATHGAQVTFLREGGV